MLSRYVGSKHDEVHSSAPEGARSPRLVRFTPGGSTEARGRGLKVEAYSCPLARVLAQRKGFDVAELTLHFHYSLLMILRMIGVNSNDLFPLWLISQ